MVNENGGAAISIRVVTEFGDESPWTGSNSSSSALSGFLTIPHVETKWMGRGSVGEVGELQWCPA